jgi:hypothetical protein
MFCTLHINYSHFIISLTFLQKIRRRGALVVEINSDEEVNEKTKVRSLYEEKFELNGLGDDNRQNEDKVHILEKSTKSHALEEAINSGTWIKKKLMTLNQ